MERGNDPRRGRGRTGTKQKVFEATADTLDQDPQIVWKDISSTASLTYDGGAAIDAVSHGPKVIPPDGGYETSRYGDRPFPVVPVDYSDRSHGDESTASKLAGKINDAENPCSTLNLYPPALLHRRVAQRRDDLKDVPAGTPVTLTFKSRWDTEWDFDYGFVLTSTTTARRTSRTSPPTATPRRPPRTRTPATARAGTATASPGPAAPTVTGRRPSTAWPAPIPTRAPRREVTHTARVRLRANGARSTLTARRL